MYASLKALLFFTTALQLFVQANLGSKVCKAEPATLPCKLYGDKIPKLKALEIFNLIKGYLIKHILYDAIQTLGIRIEDHQLIAVYTHGTKSPSAGGQLFCRHKAEQLSLVYKSL